MVEQWLSITEAAGELTDTVGGLVRPRDISNLLYDKALREDSCPRIGNRHVIARSYLPEIARILLRKGWIVQTEGGSAR